MYLLHINNKQIQCKLIAIRVTKIQQLISRLDRRTLRPVNVLGLLVFSITIKNRIIPFHLLITEGPEGH